MKKSLIAIAAIICGSLLTLNSCMTSRTASNTAASTGSSASSSQSSTAGNILGSLLGSLIGNAVPVNEKNIAGTWVYSAPEVRFESEDFLSKAGGEVAAASIEKKLSDLYSKVGITPGSCTYVFNADKTCSVTIGGKAINGTFTVDSANNAIEIKSNTGLIKLKGKVFFGLNSLIILFDADKILSIVQTVAAFTGDNNSTLGTLAGALNQYQGLMLGMNLQKQ